MKKRKPKSFQFLFMGQNFWCNFGTDGQHEAFFKHWCVSIGELKKLRAWCDKAIAWMEIHEDSK